MFALGALAASPAQAIDEHRRSGGLTKKEKYLVALDVGSTKTCAIISELNDTGAKICGHGRGGIQRACARD